MKTITAMEKAVFQPLTIQLTFKTAAELEAFETTFGRISVYSIQKRITELGEIYSYLNSLSVKDSIISTEYISDYQISDFRNSVCK